MYGDPLYITMELHQTPWGEGGEEFKFCAKEPFMIPYVHVKNSKAHGGKETKRKHEVIYCYQEPIKVDKKVFFSSTFMGSWYNACIHVYTHMYMYSTQPWWLQH